MIKTKEVQATAKVRLYPSAEQEQLLKQFCGAARWVYNWGLSRWKDRYSEGLNTSPYELANELVLMKKLEATSWLTDIPAQGLQQSLLNLGKAFKRFFAKQALFPKFKKYGYKDSFIFPQFVTLGSDKKSLKFH